MKKISVPRSVRKAGRKAFAERYVKLFIYLLLAYIVAEYIYEGLKTTDFGNLSTTVFLIFIIPFWASGVPFKVMDRDWYGKIIKIDIKNNDTVKIDNHEQFPVAVTALIKTPDGKLYEREIYDEGEIFSHERENVYNVGDTVVHIKGTEYLFPIRKDGDTEPMVCAVCGSKYPVGTKVCQGCGCSMEIRLFEKERK